MPSLDVGTDLNTITQTLTVATTTTPITLTTNDELMQHPTITRAHAGRQRTREEVGDGEAAEAGHVRRVQRGSGPPSQVDGGPAGLRPVAPRGISDITSRGDLLGTSIVVQVRRVGGRTRWGIAESVCAGRFL